MSLVPLVGEGWWIPRLPPGISGNEIVATNDTALLDLHGEEVQLLGYVRRVGRGSATFGLNSTLDWLPGAAITFAAGATLRLGVKPGSAVDLTTGPPARATLGPAAFSVYRDLVGGTDPLTATTWRSDPMQAGTPFTVTHGDLLALCFHLTVTSGTPSVKLRMVQPNAIRALPAVTLVTSGPTYTALTAISAVILTFDDGSLGWLDPSVPTTAADANTAAIGSGNILGNIVRLPAPLQIDALGAVVNTPVGGTGDCALEVYAAPLSATPVLLASLSQDTNVVAQAGQARTLVRELATPLTLAANTDYAIGVKQSSAVAVLTMQRDVADAAFFQSMGFGAECYAVQSVAGATFTVVSSGRRRVHTWMRVCALEDGVVLEDGPTAPGSVLVQTLEAQVLVSTAAGGRAATVTVTLDDAWLTSTGLVVLAAGTGTAAVSITRLAPQTITSTAATARTGAASLTLAPQVLTSTALQPTAAGAPGPGGMAVRPQRRGIGVT